MAAPLANPQQHYLKTQIETASKPQLLVMIFNAAVKKLHMAKSHMEKKEIEKAHTELTKVQRIFTELMVALDFEKGGEIAENLLRIYDFIYHHLVKANIKQDAKMVEEIIPIVDDLRDGWTKAVEKFQSEQEGGIAQTSTVAHADSSPVLPKIPTSIPRPAAFSRPVPPVTATPPGEAQPQRPRLNIRG